MPSNIKISSHRSILILLILISASIQLLWVMFDRSAPAWDEAAHLTNVLTIQKVIEQIQVFSPEWWHKLWEQAPSYRAPFIYILTVPFFCLFGKSFNSGVLVNLLFIPTLVCATYYLARQTFGLRIGLWAAGICLMFPALLAFQLDYLLDYGIVAISTLAFLLLTLWKDAKTKLESWRWSLLFGVIFGCLMLAKPTGFLFLLLPGIFLLCSFFKQHNWLGLLQFGSVLTISWGIFGGWFRQNWLTIITSAVGANAMGVGEGDPPGNTLEGWLYYIKLLPELISLPILVATVGCTLVWLFKRSTNNQPIQSKQILWLLVYAIGAYSFCSLATNKDGRFISPLLPIVSVFAAYILNIFQTIWFRRLRWLTITLNGLILLIHLLPISAMDRLRESTHIGYRYPQMLQTQPELSGQQLINAVAKDNPYLKSNIGSLISSREVNFENLDFYGQAHDFQVYAREFSGSFNERQLIDRDIKALNWYAIGIGEFAHVNKLLPIVERDPNLKMYQSWQMRNGNLLKLYRRKELPIVVEPIAERIDNIQLEQVTISPSSGLGIDTTYQLSGERELLKDGILILTWSSKAVTWNHDRGIGLGELYLDRTNHPSFRIIEHSAMLPPTNLPIDTYQLTATYLNRRTGAIFPLTVPKIQIRAAQARPHQLDLITQLHQLGGLFAQGKTDSVFSEIAILNQYDPVQDYLVQAQQAIKYRIDRGDNRLELRYTLALCQALQRQIDPLLANLTQIVRQDARNPSAWTYLGVVRLYNWQPQAAETAFQQAERLPNPPSALATLKIVSALFRCDLPQLWQRLHR